MSPRDRILASLSELGPDEAEVLAIVAERLVTGRKAYSELQIATDRRDFQHEALLELADGCAYLAAGIVRARRVWAELVGTPPNPAGRLVGAERGR